jgi:peptide/nickel transport system ATP-binding protein
MPWIYGGSMGYDAPLLIVESLTIGRPNGPGYIFQVKDFSLTLSPGEKFALVGESGSGKTLTAGALVGLLPAPWVVTSGRMVSGRRMVSPGTKCAAGP